MSTSTDLWADFLTNPGRLIHKWNHYFSIYQDHLDRFRNRPTVMLEIGCGQGGSLALWKRFLGPHARIVGVDLNPGCKAHEEDQVDVRIGNQADAGFVQSLLDEFGAPDIVVDDGSHRMPDVCATFGLLYPRMSPNGVYAVEDLHTAYWPEYEGGLRREGTFIEVCKGLVDELNADHTQGALPPTAFTRSTMSMHFYDSVVVFERGATRPNRSLASHAGTVFHTPT